MKSSRLVIDIAAVGILIAMLHRNAIIEAWYWSYWWMDIPMHFLGGLFVGLLVLWILQQFSNQSFTKKQTFLAVLVGILIVSIGWEIFEYTVGVFALEEFFPDTLYDLVMGTLGAVAAYVYTAYGSDDTEIRKDGRKHA